MPISDRKVDARNFDNNDIILYPLRSSKFTFEGDFRQNLGCENAGVELLYRVWKIFCVSPPLS